MYTLKYFSTTVPRDYQIQEDNIHSFLSLSVLAQTFSAKERNNWPVAIHLFLYLRDSR